MEVAVAVDGDGTGAIVAVGVALLAAAATLVSGARSLLSSSGGGGGGEQGAGGSGGSAVTPNFRGKGDSDDSKGRRYLIAPPPLFPLVPAFARQTVRDIARVESLSPQPAPPLYCYVSMTSLYKILQ